MVPLYAQRSTLQNAKVNKINKKKMKMSLIVWEKPFDVGVYIGGKCEGKRDAYR